MHQSFFFVCHFNYVFHLFFVFSSIDYISSPRSINPINKKFDPSHLYALPSKSVLRTNQDSYLAGVASTSTAIPNSNRNLPKISLGERFKNSVHSSSQESNNSHSDHSGASGVTLPLDEPIEYVDAWNYDKSKLFEFSYLATKFDRKNDEDFLITIYIFYFLHFGLSNNFLIMWFCIFIQQEFNRINRTIRFIEWA